MTYKQARKRYFAVLIPGMAVFLAGSILIDRADAAFSMSVIALAALAVVPILALLAAHWAMARFLVEVDEFLRMIHTRALLGGTAVVLAVAASWGYLEAYAGVGAMPVLWMVPIFWVAYSAAAVILSRRAGVEL